MPTDLPVIHASMKWDRVKRPQFAKDLAALQKTCLVIVLTEIGGLTDAELRKAAGDWLVFRGPNVPGQDECAILWHPSLTPVAAGSAQKLSDLQYQQTDGDWMPKFYAAVQPLRFPDGQVVTFVGIHMPLRNTARRVKVSDDCLRFLAQWLPTIEGHVVVSADWNIAWRKSEGRALLEPLAAATGLTWAWRDNVEGFDTKRSLIDGVLTDLPVRESTLLPAIASSDHWPVRVDLTLPDPAPLPTPPQEAPVAQPYLIEHPPARRQFKARGTTFSGVCVIHTAESAPDVTGMDLGAEGVAKFIRGRSDPGCYHYLADSDSLIQMVPLDLQTYGDGTGSNPHAVHISAATQAAKWPGLPKAWTEKTVKNMALAAHKASDYCFKLHGVRIPARRVTKTQSSNRVEGFISHGERDPGRRTDPGAGFPWDLFFAEYKRLEGTDKPASPEKEAPVGNNVQQGIALIKQGLVKLDAARLNGKTRLGVQLMARAIRVALASGPKS